MAASPPRRIAHVSTFPPTRCGIASYVTSLIGAMPQHEHRPYLLHFGGDQSVHEAAQASNTSAEELASLARTISASDCDLVYLQHEFGIWGGMDGKNIHPFLDNLTKPYVAVLHTTFRPGMRNDRQALILRRLVDESVATVALTAMAGTAVDALCGERISHLHVIPHGVPEFPYAAPQRQWGASTGEPLRLIALGFVIRNKGLTTLLHAMKLLTARGHNISCRIAGASQQHLNYAPRSNWLQDHVEQLGLQSVVSIDHRYLTVEEQHEALREAHAGIVAYQDPVQSSSGILPLMLGSGRPVISTPFEYACAKSREGRGVFLADGFDAEAIADAVAGFAGVSDYPALTKEIYDRTRSDTWSAVGEQFSELCSRI